MSKYRCLSYAMTVIMVFQKQNGKVKGKTTDAHNKKLPYRVSVTDIDVLNDNRENPKNGWLEERLGDPSVANQTSEVEEVCSHVNIERPQESDVVLDSPFPDNCDINHVGSNDEYGDWVTYWDEFYGRNYYYNCRTQESTWELPLGMEQLPSVSVPNQSKEDDIIDASKSDSKEENFCVLQHGVVLYDELTSEVALGQLDNEHHVGLDFAADSLDNVITSSTVSCFDIHLNETFEVNESTEGRSLADLPDTLHPSSRYLYCLASE